MRRDMETRQVTLTLDSDVAHLLEIRAAIDDLTLIQGLEQLINECATRFVEKRQT